MYNNGEKMKNNYKEMFQEFIKNNIMESYINFLKESVQNFLDNGKNINNPIINQFYALEANLNSKDIINSINEIIKNKELQLKLNQKYPNYLLNLIFTEEKEEVPFSSISLEVHRYQDSIFNHLIKNHQKDLINFSVNHNDINLVSKLLTSKVNFKEEILNKTNNNLKVSNKQDLAEVMINEFIKLSKELNYNAILNNNGIDQSIECGWMWQFHSYIEESSYREIRVSLESEKDCNDIQLILGDDILDYDGVSAEEVQYYKTYSKDILGLNQLISDVQNIAKTINENGDNPDRFHDYESDLLELGLESRY
jgi:hypothetical protein